MSTTRLKFAIVAALAVALIAIPLSASAETLKNNYGLQFAGQAKCIECHNDPDSGVFYDDTTHGKFNNAGIGGAPSETGNLVSIGGATVAAEDVFFTLGYGTGLRETIKAFDDGEAITSSLNASPQSYLGVIAGLENFWKVKEGGENVFDMWEYPLDADEPEFEAYCGGNCHNLGYTKGAPNPVATNATGSSSTYQGWAAPWNAPEDVLNQYDLRAMSETDRMAGAGIQCENCHGTGVASTENDHWGTGVMINSQSGQSISAPTSEEIRPLLRSDVCGQCHGSYRTANFLGYTPDKPLYLFASVQIGATEIPTEASYTADVAGFEADPTGYNGGAGRLKFRYLWPNGINSGYMFERADGSTYQAGMKHVYYTEWALTGHSYRSKLTSSSPDASMYQKSTTMNGLGGGGLSNATSAYRDSRCGYCHAGEVYLKRKGDPIASEISTDNASIGYLGVECASCHILHNAETEKDGAVGMALREPSEGNITVCEDCHKERQGVMGTGATFAYDISRTGNSGAGLGAAGSHAGQGDVLHGDGMMDVPSIQGAMSGVACQMCHMPSTRADFPDVGLERYVDRSFKRYTHSMRIVEPGDEVLDPEPWQDSCSPCHAGETQAELQAYIDELQATGEELEEAAGDAITAADARVSYVGTATPSANKALLDRAFNNYTMAEGESSDGFHNPDYTQAGLERAIQMANSVGGEIEAVTGFVGAGAEMGFVAGTLEYGTEAPAADEHVALLRDGSVFGHTMTDANGNFSFTIAADATHTYTVVWERCDDPIADLTESVTVVVPKIATDLELDTSKASAKRMTYFTVSGELDPHVAGARIVLSFKRPGASSYTSWTTVTVDSDGHFARRIRVGNVGTMTFRARYAGNTQYSASSATAKIRIYR